MTTGTLIALGLLINLGVFVCFPETGRFGVTFLYLSCLLWTAFAFFLGSRAPFTRLGRWLRALAFAAACLFACLSFLPQKDNNNPLEKLTRGQYPDRRSVFLGLLRLGIDYPGLLPPQKEEVLP
ncbi:MAG: hypothetical protein NDI60_07670 [Elusimicrobiales bacterium]|nr:hypothetical protein [Elusimicrobiales bacterium]